VPANRHPGVNRSRSAASGWDEACAKAIAGTQGHEGVTDEGGGQVSRVVVAACVRADHRDDAPLRLARLLGELGEVVLDRLPRGKQQQLEQRGLGRAPGREHELEVIGHHLVNRLTPVDDVTGEGRDLIRISG
jgi:hypothetical protein